MEINVTQIAQDEKFVFTSGLKKTLGILLIIGVVLLGLGLAFGGSEGHHEAEGHGEVSHVETTTIDEAGEHEMQIGEGDHEMIAGHEGEHAAEAAAEGGHGEAPSVWTRLLANLWINNVYFTGIALIGVFFFAIQYVAQAGWSASLIRIMINLGAWLPIAAVLMLVVWVIGSHDLFHWTHESLYDESNPATYDPIIAGKQSYLNTPFYLGRMVVYFLIWAGFFFLLRKKSLEEDLKGGTSYWYTLRKYSAIFVVLFAVTSSMSAWDWVMSIDPHWFSTLFGWYVFASWFVSGLAVITLITVFLKEAGYLKLVNANHLHDLGKFVFAFSIFWTYLWFSQFLLIYYANIPEEITYFIQRLSSDYYSPIFFVNLILNFFFPFLVLMTRDAKRHTIFLKIACSVILLGHWLDFYLMVTPGVMKEYGGFGMLEIGLILIYGSAFLFVTLTSLSKAALVPKHHPMLAESANHHI